MLHTKEAPESDSHGFFHGKYFSSALAASRAYGFTWDKVGRVLRKSRAETGEAFAWIKGFPPLLSARNVYDNGWLSLREPFRQQFPSVFRDFESPLKRAEQEAALNYAI